MGSYVKKVMELDPKIRFAGLINGRGRLLAGGMREETESLGDQKDDEIMYMEFVRREKMRASLTRYDVT